MKTSVTRAMHARTMTRRGLNRGLFARAIAPGAAAVAPGERRAPVDGRVLPDGPLPGDGRAARRAVVRGGRPGRRQ